MKTIRNQNGEAVPEDSVRAEIEYTATTAGVLTLKESNPWYVWRDAVLRRIRISLGVAGTTSTIVSIRKNGVQLNTITLTSGVTTILVTYDTTFTTSDVFTVAITQIGTDAERLSVQAAFD